MKEKYTHWTAELMDKVIEFNMRDREMEIEDKERNDSSMQDRSKEYKKIENFVKKLLVEERQKGYKGGYYDCSKNNDIPLNMTYEWLKDVDTSKWV